MKNLNGLKVIAGINNFDVDNVCAIARAAQNAGAEALDVAATPAIVAVARAEFSGVLFASSVNPAELAAAVEAGADVAELGNFDALYEEGVFLDQNEVLRLAKETVATVAGRALVSITIPGHLATDAQVALATRLADAGADVIQSEGSARLLSASREVAVLGAEDKFALTLANTRALVKASKVPVICASGITPANAAEAFRAGAAAIGVGSVIRAAKTEAAMTEVIVALKAAIPVCEVVAAS